MNWTELIQHYGYWAIFAGTLFEGETVLMLGAYAVHQHLLNFWLLLSVAMLGSFIGDQFYYQLGVRYGQKMLESQPEFAKKFQRASQFIDRYPILTILGMRFAWGLRTVLPIAVGIKAYPIWKYVLINIVACFIWAWVVISAGVYITHALHAFWQYILPYDEELYTVIAVIVCIALGRVVYGYRQKLTHQRSKNK
ncbi:MULTISPECIES: DedA family protein [Acinetobacter]|nr:MULTISPECIES: DedA family protein [Acinetobacter]